MRIDTKQSMFSSVYVTLMYCTYMPNLIASCEAVSDFIAVEYHVVYRLQMSALDYQSSAVTC